MYSRDANCLNGLKLHFEHITVDSFNNPIGPGYVFLFPWYSIAHFLLVYYMATIVRVLWLAVFLKWLVITSELSKVYTICV